MPQAIFDADPERVVLPVQARLQMYGFFQAVFLGIILCNFLFPASLPDTNVNEWINFEEQ